MKAVMRILNDWLNHSRREDMFGCDGIYSDAVNEIAELESENKTLLELTLDLAKEYMLFVQEGYFRSTRRPDLAERVNKALGI